MAETLRAGGVGTIYLVHGTFVGFDGFGLWQELTRYWSALGSGARVQKSMLDFVLRDIGNFPPRYAREFAAGLGGSEDPVPAQETTPALVVRRWNWDSQNNHVGRADGALRLLVDLAHAAPRDGRRVLLWGHSHAGNLFALLTNLLAGDDAEREQFFTAIRPNYLTVMGHLPADSIWHAARGILADDLERLRSIPLDMVTFGTPIRYGWDSTAYARLLHIVHHRPASVRPQRTSGLPFRFVDAWTAREGDYVQRFGIAGTNLAPCWLSRWKARRADWQLHGLVQRGVTSRGLFERLRAPLRVADESTTIAIDYGPQRGGPLFHLFGHGVYTRRIWMLFHAELVAEQFYGQRPRDGISL